MMFGEHFWLSLLGSELEAGAESREVGVTVEVLAVLGNCCRCCGLASLTGGCRSYGSEIYCHGWPGHGLWPFVYSVYLLNVYLYI